MARPGEGVPLRSRSPSGPAGCGSCAVALRLGGSRRCRARARFEPRGGRFGGGFEVRVRWCLWRLVFPWAQSLRRGGCLFLFIKKVYLRCRSFVFLLRWKWAFRKACGPWAGLAASGAVPVSTGGRGPALSHRRVPCRAPCSPRASLWLLGEVLLPSSTQKREESRLLCAEVAAGAEVTHRKLICMAVIELQRWQN